jgi:hypothetical protein
VIRRVNADFVPVALRAPLVNGVAGALGDEDSWVYQRIKRALLAPQGIGVLDSSGQVLVWTQMFDDDQSVLDFLEHSLKRFHENAGAKPPVATERFARFPTGRVDDFVDDAKIPPIAQGHAGGKSCPAQSAKGVVPPGSIVARLVGRALDAKGEPLADTVNQEHYAEDQFVVAPAMQEAIAKALAAGSEPKEARSASERLGRSTLTRSASEEPGRSTLARSVSEEAREPARVRLPDEFSKLCASHAHLGHIDVRPLLNMRTGPDNRQGVGGTVQNKGQWRQCEFRAEKVANGRREPPDRSANADRSPGKETTLWRLEGESEVTSELAINGRGVHEVKLAWEGFLEVKENRVTRLVLGARGSEKLQFAKDDHPLLREKRDEVAFLPGGRPIDLACGVRYGIIGVPVADSEVTTDPPAPRVPSSEPPAQDPARQLMEALGPQFAIFLSAVQDDLNLSDQQKQMLRQMKSGAAEGLQKFTEQIQNAPDEQRGNLQQQFREQANKQVSEVLAQLLQPEQHKRLRQIVLQQQGLFALADAQVAAELKFAGEQERRLLMRIMQETQKRLQEFQQKAQEKIQQTAQTTGNPEEVQKEAAKLQQEAAKIRQEQEAKIEALLSDAQKTQWKAMLGKPLALELDHPEKN